MEGRRKEYGRIRGLKQEDRCTDPIKGRLYCDCGCQDPHNDDPSINLMDIIVSGRANHGYADYTLTRDGQEVGEINTQYCALVLDGYEYLGCNRDEMSPLFDQIFDGDVNRFAHPQNNSAGDTLAETVATVRLAEKIALMEQDERCKNHPGYCTVCHSYCYGDCEAN